MIDLQSAQIELERVAWLTEKERNWLFKRCFCPECLMDRKSVEKFKRLVWKYRDYMSPPTVADVLLS